MPEALQQIQEARPRRFRPYREYKDSGVAWLGEIPAHWEVKRLKNCVYSLESGGTPESDNLEYWTDDESGKPWVAISDMTRSFRVRETGRHLTERGLRSKRLPVLPAGTLLYSMYASLGKVAVLEVDAVVNQAILGLVTRDDLAARDYLRWWLEFMQGHVEMLSSSNTQDNLNADKVRKMPIFVPSPDEQTTIAGFLERETAKIDALVARKERLIELLQEKRTALITRAVTRGLDPNVPLKDSGVEWLGEIPAHWTVKPLRWVIVFQRGHDLPAEDREDGDVPVVSSSGVSSLHSRAVARAPGIVTGRYGTIGHFHLIEQDYWPLNTTLYSIHLHGNEARFLRYMLTHLSPLFLLHAVKSAVPGVDRNDIHPTPTTVPPLHEQVEIADYLDSKCVELDWLTGKIREAIDRLKEFRTALISAAVTGKIDVREGAA